MLLLGPLAGRAQAPPANDDCAGALALPVAAIGSNCASFTATNAGATASAGMADPSCAAYYQGGDVWYTVTVPTSGALQLTTSAAPGSAVDDTQLTLYSGSCGGSLTEIGCNDDISGRNYFSRIVVGGLPAGQVLLLRATTYGNYTQGKFELCAQELAPCAAPTGVAVGGIRPTQATVSFAPNAAASGYSVSYAPAGGPAQTVSTAASPIQLTGLLPATTYTVQVASDCGGSQPASPAVSFTTSPALTNDDCAGALALAISPACTSPTRVATLDASASAGVADPPCGNYQGGDLWYSVTVPANGVVLLETSDVSGSNAPYTGLAAYSGSCGSLTLLGCDDSQSGNQFSYLRLTGQPAGATLYVRAWVQGGPSSAEFSLCATTDDALPTTTWTGAASQDWAAAGNWTSGVPTTGTNAYLPAGVASGRYPQLTATTVASVHTLSIDKGASLTATTGTLRVAGSVRNRQPFLPFVDKQANSGPFSFYYAYAGGVQLQLIGSEPQQVSGLDQLYNLEVASTSMATLTSKLTVYHALTMHGGLLSTGLSWVELGRATTDEFDLLSAARLVQESETSYVLGRVQTRRAVDAGQRDDFSGLGLTLVADAASAAVPGFVTLNRYTGLAQPGVGSRPAVLRAYDAQPDADANLSLTMDLHYFAHERNGLADADLRPYSSPGGLGGPWAQEPGSTRLGPIAPDSASALRLAGLTHLSGWTLGAAAAPLPVQLVRFTAEPTGADVQLRWATASELNNRQFTIEVSADGRAFAAVGQVAGQGSSAQAHAYAFTDADVAHYGAPRLYYRLHQLNLDGTGSYSPVQAVALGATWPGSSPELTAYPNPFGPALRLQLPAGLAGPVQLVLRDALGRERLRQTSTLAAGAAIVEVAGVAQLPPGLYVLAVQAAGYTGQVKVSRQ